MNKFLSIFCISILLFSNNIYASASVIDIASGSKDGVYYKIAGVICKFINHDEHHKYCTVHKTKATEENLKLFFQKEVNFAIIQEETMKILEKQSIDHYQAINPVMKLYEEVFVLAVEDSNSVKEMNDIRDKNIVVYENNSGVKNSLANLLAYVNTNKENTKITEMNEKDLTDNICNNQAVGAFMYGHPSDFLYHLSKKCNIRFIEIEYDFITKYPFYHMSNIPGGLYFNNAIDTKSFATNAILITSKNLDANVIKKVTDNFINNLDKIKMLHTVLHNIKVDDLKVMD